LDLRIRRKDVVPFFANLLAHRHVFLLNVRNQERENIAYSPLCWRSGIRISVEEFVFFLLELSLRKGTSVLFGRRLLLGKGERFLGLLFFSYGELVKVLEDAVEEQGRSFFVLGNNEKTADEEI